MQKFKKLTFYLFLFSFILGACGRQDKKDFDAIKENLQAEQLEELNEGNQKTFEEITDRYENEVTL